MRALTFIVVAVVASLAWATETYATVRWSLGVKGGVNFADLSGDISFDETSSRVGFIGGVFAEAGFTDEVGLRLEALSVAKGTDFTQFIVNTSVDGTVQLGYIEFPVLLVIHFPPGPRTTSFSFFVGPTFGFNTSSEVETAGLGFDIDDAVEGFEFGGTFGAGFEYALSSLSLVFDIRYSFGITDAIEDMTQGNNIEVSTRGIGVMAGVAFPLQ